MSQVSIVDIEHNNPQIPTRFNANQGFAIPIGNVLEIYGETVAAGSVPVQTVGSGNNITTQVQISQSIAATDVTKVGLSAFNSSDFSVDANGFVSLSGTGLAQTITGQSGGALSPSAGNWNIFGALSSAGASPVVTSGSGNTLTVNVQTSQALASADSTKVGLSNFDSSSFVVNASGFVTLSSTSVGKTITGDTGGALSPTAGNWNILGDTAQGITSSGLGSTLTFTNADWTTSQKGVGVLATNAETISGLSTTKVVTPDDLKAKLGIQTDHGVLVGRGTSAAVDALAVGTNGQVLLGSTGANPSFGTLTSSDNSISFTLGAGSLSLQVAGGTSVGKTITGDTGGALSPTAGNWNIIGSGSIATSGSASNLTVQLTGLTNHSLLVGAGTTTITKVGPSATAGQVLQSSGPSADPAFSTATYPSTTTVNQLLYSSSSNIVNGLATANSASLVTNSTGVPVWSSPMTNGQLIIGNTSGTPTAATPTSTGGSFITGAGTLKYQPANYTLGISNLGVSYNAGTFTILDSTGSSLSSFNPAYVTIQSKTTPGISKTIPITVNQDFIDDAGASEIIGNLFGLPSGVAYSEDIPFYIYGILNDSEDTIKFAICRIPNRSTAPITANLGCPGTANADTQGSMFIFDSVTLGDYDTNPCICLGSIRMRMSSANDWTVQALASTDGIGNFNEYTIFNIPLGSFGAATGTFIKANGGTAPVFSTNLYTYHIDRLGRVQQSFYMNNDGGADGAGAVITYMCAALIPAETEHVPDSVCLLVYGNSANLTAGYVFYDSVGVSGWRFNTSAVLNVTNALFIAGGRQISGKLYFLLSLF